MTTMTTRRWVWGTFQSFDLPFYALINYSYPWHRTSYVYDLLCRRSSHWNRVPSLSSFLRFIRSPSRHTLDPSPTSALCCTINSILSSLLFFCASILLIALAIPAFVLSTTLNLQFQQTHLTARSTECLNRW